VYTCAAQYPGGQRLTATVTVTTDGKDWSSTNWTA
jgi:hypothetical protein